ncbi:MAG: signal peptidase II [Pseudomonadota bacterium]
MFKRNKITFISMSIIGVTAALDLISKHIVDAKMNLYQTIQVIPDFFNLVYVKNMGAAFSFLNDAPAWFRKPFFFIIPLAVIALVASLLIKYKTERLKLVAFSLVIGGALGNFINRIEYGYVIDFLDFKITPTYHWPSFNVADIAITTAVTILFIDMIKIENKKRKDKNSKKKK